LAALANHSTFTVAANSFEIAYFQLIVVPEPNLAVMLIGLHRIAVNSCFLQKKRLR
jgi:hypothetical protein